MYIHNYIAKHLKMDDYESIYYVIITYFHYNL